MNARDANREAITAVMNSDMFLIERANYGVLIAYAKSKAAEADAERERSAIKTAKLKQEALGYLNRADYLMNSIEEQATDILFGRKPRA